MKERRDVRRRDRRSFDRRQGARRLGPRREKNPDRRDLLEWGRCEWLADLAQAALDATREEAAKGGAERRATASDARRALFAGIYGTIEMPRDYVDRTAARYRPATSS